SPPKEASALAGLTSRMRIPLLDDEKSLANFALVRECRLLLDHLTFHRSDWGPAQKCLPLPPFAPGSVPVRAPDGKGPSSTAARAQEAENHL
ncbi:hypothetical protein, partial [Bordetella pseudohinzii]|uniref:hypothetical protein n=1 Tax=Bordetella pseudohinzii TaxID=1331258 RepID=UPI001F230EB0